MPEEEIIVVGAGASGMMAAMTAAQNGGRVLLLEKMKTPGKKLLATGNGKCNFTNRYQAAECYRGEDETFIREALELFPCEDVLRVFHRMGILPRERQGYYYPASEQAASVVEAFRRCLNDYRVPIQCEERVVSICREDRCQNGLSGYVLETEKNSYRAKTVILAMGGKAAPVHGTDGDGFVLAKTMGLRLIEPLPALTSCILKGNFMKEWSGVRVLGQISLYNRQGECLAEDQGELQMVSYGLSGIPVFQISRYVSRALQKKEQPYLVMDVMTAYTEQEIEEELSYRQHHFPKWTGVDVLDGMMHRKLAKVCLKSLGLDPGQSIGTWTPQQISAMADRMKNWKLGIEGVSGFDKAQVTCGGIGTGQIDSRTMEVKQYPGLYITGEMLDVDGICGGYNLQWAWTSGYLAGRSAAQNSRQQHRNGQVKHD